MKNIFILFTLIVFCSCGGGNTNIETVVVAEKKVDGEQIFKINCGQCHKPTEELIGPPLKGVTSRWKDRNLLYEFVRNSQDVIQRDEYAKSLFEKYKQSPMPPMPNLTNEEIDAVFTYCDEFK